MATFTSQPLSSQDAPTKIRGRSEDLVGKATTRRQRVAIFGGAQSELQGRRSQEGKVFNRRNQPVTGGDTGPTYTGAGGADLGLEEGVTPVGNLWQTWTPTAEEEDIQYGTLSTGATGYYDPTTGRFIYYDFGDENDGD